MPIFPVVVLAGAPGWTGAMLRRLGTEPAMRDVLVVADEGSADASPGCTCCAVAGGLTRALREAYFASAAGGGRAFTRVVVDATGVDPRPAIAALARSPLASLRFALSAIACAAAEEDTLATSLADAAIDPARCGVEDLFAPGLYRAGGPDARGWLDRALVPRATWSRPEPWDAGDVEPAVQALQLALGDRLVRLKGLVHVSGEPGPRLVQAFGHTRYPAARLPDRAGAPRESTLAVATRPLDSAPIARILDLFPFRRTP